MPKYIFTKAEYAKFVHKEYQDVPLKEPKGKKYKARKIRWYPLPGARTAKDKFGFSLGIDIGVNSFAPGGVYESHKHDSPTFYLVLSGKATVTVGDEERVVGPGAWVYTPPNVNHVLVNNFKKPFTYITAETHQEV